MMCSEKTTCLMNGNWSVMRKALAVRYNEREELLRTGFFNAPGDFSLSMRLLSVSCDGITSVDI